MGCVSQQAAAKLCDLAGMAGVLAELHLKVAGSLTTVTVCRCPCSTAGLEYTPQQCLLLLALLFMLCCAVLCRAAMPCRGMLRCICCVLPLQYTLTYIPVSRVQHTTAAGLRDRAPNVVIENLNVMSSHPYPTCRATHRPACTAVSQITRHQLFIAYITVTAASSV